MQTILVVDDDPDIRRLIMEALRYESFDPITVGSGPEALELLKTRPVDFIILDIMMPEIDGMEVCRRIRKDWPTPIMILSAKDREIDKVVGFEIGADDYMTKPFSVNELIARIKAHFRKIERLGIDLEREKSQAVPENCPLIINDDSYEVFLNGHKTELSTKEFQILSYLYRHPNQVLTREKIYNTVWGDDFGDINTVTVHIKNLRSKLGKENDFIKTIWGVGYKFTMEA